jgi:predicted DNA-binding transcriptional regulator AlpA
LRELRGPALSKRFSNTARYAFLAPVITALIREAKMARRLLRYEDLRLLGYWTNRMGVSRAVASGFPQPVEIGPNSIGWWEDEVDEYDRDRRRRSYKFPDKKTAAPEAAE